MSVKLEKYKGKYNSIHRPGKTEVQSNIEQRCFSTRLVTKFVVEEEEPFSHSY